MKKFFKVVGSLAVVGAAVAGGVALYKKYFASEDILDDFEDELDDEFEEEDLDASTRGYTTLNNVAEAAKEVASDVKEAAAEVAEEVKEDAAEIAEEVKEDAAEAVEEVKETLSE